MKVLLIFYFILFTAALFSQTGPGIEWQNTIGGNDYDIIYTVQQTADGGYIAGGQSYSEISGNKTAESFGDSDYWIVKFDSIGNIEWQKTFGGSEYDNLKKLKQTSDGGYILAGVSGSGMSGNKTEDSKGKLDWWVIKIDGEGNIMWQKTLGGSENDWMFDVIQTNNKGYLGVGNSWSDISGDKSENNRGIAGESNDWWIICLDSAGSIMWQKTLGGSSFDNLLGVDTTDDNGYILGGWSASDISGDKTEENFGEADYWVIKIDSLGTVNWQNTIGGSDDDQMHSIQTTSDHGFILGGYSSSDISGERSEANLGLGDYWVIKLTSFGEIEWQNAIGGSGSDLLLSVKQTADNGYILAGFSSSDSSSDKHENRIGDVFDYDYWVVKLSNDGTINWENTIGGIEGDDLLAIEQTSDQGYILGGSSSSDISVDKTDAAFGGGDYWIVKLYAENSCEIPSGLYADDITAFGATLHWNEIAGVDQYTVSLWKADDFTTIGKKHLFTNSIAISSSLMPSTTYGFRIKSTCYDEETISPYSDAVYFTTLPLRSEGDLSGNLQLSIYPNPSNGDFTIQLPELNNKGEIFISIKNIIGEEIYTEQLNTFELNHEIHLPGTLSGGLYFVELETNDRIYSQQIIIAK